VRNRAQRVQSHITPLGSVQVMTASVKGIEMYREQLRPPASLEEADQFLARAVDGGYPEARIIVD
jgi:hypothetical protein